MNMIELVRDGNLRKILTKRRELKIYNFEEKSKDQWVMRESMKQNWKRAAVLKIEEDRMVGDLSSA